MTTPTHSNARQQLRKLIDQVNLDDDVVTITTNDRNAVLMSETHYHSLMETLYLLQSPANAQRLAKSVEDAEQGRTIEVKLNNSKHD